MLHHRAAVQRHWHHTLRGDVVTGICICICIALPVQIRLKKRVVLVLLIARMKGVLGKGIGHRRLRRHCGSLARRGGAQSGGSQNWRFGPQARGGQWPGIGDQRLGPARAVQTRFAALDGGGNRRERFFRRAGAGADHAGDARLDAVTIGHFIQIQPLGQHRFNQFGLWLDHAAQERGHARQKPDLFARRRVLRGFGQRFAIARIGPQPGRFAKGGRRGFGGRMAHHVARGGRSHGRARG